MKVSFWKKETEPLQFADSWLSTVGIEKTRDGMPLNCVVILARYNDEGEIVTMELKMDLDESTQIVDGWDKALGNCMDRYLIRKSEQ